MHLTYTSLANAALNILNCNELDDKYYLAKDMDEEC